MILSPEALGAFEAHVLDAYPYEAAGVVCRGTYVPCRNAAADPLRDFAITGEDMAKAELEHGPVEAILHSHPYDIAHAPQHPAEWPSHLDMQSWIKGKTPWGIVATDGQGLSPVYWLDDSTWEPLVGREFKWGVNDCYSLIRDYFRQERGILLPNYPRQWKFWEQGIALYDGQFESAGFVEIKPSEVVPGDCCLMRMFTEIASHAALITGPDQILHHLWHRQSGYDRLSKYRRTITKYVRYVGDNAC